MAKKKISEDDVIGELWISDDWLGLEYSDEEEDEDE